MRFEFAQNFGSVAGFFGGVFLLWACGSEAQTTREIYLGPDAIRTVQVDSPTVLYRIGDREGPGQIEQGDALMMAPVPSGGFLMYTSYYGPDQGIQHWRNGELVRTFGRAGQGPGEYTRIGGLAVDPESGTTWVFDGAGRLVSYDVDGNPRETVSTVEIGHPVFGLAVFTDGSLLANAPGGATTTFGSLLHRYDPDEGTWSAHYPAFQDSVFSPNGDRRWIRYLAVASDGRVVALSREYVIEILQPERDFEVQTTIRRRPAGWPENVHLDNVRRREEDRLAPPFAARNAWIDDEDRLWILASEPEEDWESKVAPDPLRPWEERSLAAALDSGRDVLVEVFDLNRLRLLGSFRVDPFVRYMLGPGILARYLGDLPYPQFEIIQVTLN